MTDQYGIPKEHFWIEWGSDSDIEKPFRIWSCGEYIARLTPKQAISLSKWLTKLAAISLEDTEP